MGKQLIGLKIHIISRKIKRNMDNIFHKNNLTSVQSAILEYIYKKSIKGEKVYSKDIEKEFDMRRATSAGILQLLEKQGFIVRELENKDSRLKNIILTQKALMAQKEINKAIDENEKRIKQDISKEDIEKLLEILDKISKNIDNERTN